VVGIIFFGYGGIRGLIRLYDRKPGLMINDRGIIDYYANNGLIEWEKITRIRIVRLSIFENTLIIEVHNLEDFYSNKSRWRRFSQKLSLIPAI
jgi:hypothetical protein